MTEAASVPKSARRDKGIRADHLVNFTFSAPKAPPRPSPSSASPKFHKENFLRASFRLLLFPHSTLPSDYAPDEDVRWLDVAMAEVADVAPPLKKTPPCCPICLESPKAARVTSCGHIFCLPCLQRYLSGTSPGKTGRKCPLCFETVYASALKPLSLDGEDLRAEVSVEVGSDMEFVLVERWKKSSRIRIKQGFQSIEQFRSLRRCKRKEFEAVMDRDIAQLTSLLQECKDSPVIDEEEISFIESSLATVSENMAQWDKDFVSWDTYDFKAESSLDASLPADYVFFQAANSAPIFLHSLVYRMLLSEFGSEALLPPSISGKILEIETLQMNDVTRKRYRFLQHLPLTTSFAFVDLDVSGFLSEPTLEKFSDEIRKREKSRKSREISRKKQDLKLEKRKERFLNDWTVMSGGMSAGPMPDPPAIEEDDDFFLPLASAPSRAPSEEKPVWAKVTSSGFSSASGTWAALSSAPATARSPPTHGAWASAASKPAVSIGSKSVGPAKKGPVLFSNTGRRKY